MGLFTTKKPKKFAKVKEMEDEEEDEEADEEAEEELEEDEEEEEEPPKRVKKKKKAQPEASEEEFEASEPIIPQKLTSAQILRIFDEFDARITRLEKHSILVGARD